MSSFSRLSEIVLFEETATIYRFNRFKNIGSGVVKVLYDPIIGNYRVYAASEKTHKTLINFNIDDEEFESIVDDGYPGWGIIKCKNCTKFAIGSPRVSVPAHLALMFDDQPSYERFRALVRQISWKTFDLEGHLLYLQRMKDPLGDLSDFDDEDSYYELSDEAIDKLLAPVRITHSIAVQPGSKGMVRSCSSDLLISEKATHKYPRPYRRERAIVAPKPQPPVAVGITPDRNGPPAIKFAANALFNSSWLSRMLSENKTTLPAKKSLYGDSKDLVL